jgi:hypothetical protein
MTLPSTAEQQKACKNRKNKSISTSYFDETKTIIDEKRGNVSRLRQLISVSTAYALKSTT